ncbi:LamG-like jellyroll fold domain-containing protein [Isoptericola sp. NPDC055881]
MALVLGGIVPVSAGAEETPIECVSSVADAASAAEMAAVCGSEVEVRSARTPWDTLWATPGGGGRVELSATAVRTDVNGGWEPIDTSLVAATEPGAGITVAAPALPITFSDGTAGMPLATIASDEHVLEFHAPFGLTTPSIEDGRVIYPEVLPGVDLIATIDEDGSGFSEVLRVDSPQAAANPALAELEFPVTVSDGLNVAESEGGFVASDADGQEVFTSPTPLMWDSGSTAQQIEAAEGAQAQLAAGDLGVMALSASLDAAEVGAQFGDTLVDPATGEPVGEPVESPALSSTVAPMPVDVADRSVTITPDAGMIADPGTSWPIYIDPSIGREPVEWTALRSGMSSDYKFSGDQGLGLCDVSVEADCGRDFKSRLVWEFHNLDPIENLAASDIVYGHFSALGTSSYNCTSYAVQAYRVENIASGTTWDSNSGWTDSRLQDSRDVHHRSGCPDGPRRITWDVTDAAKYTATNGGYLTIGLKDYYENSMTRWKRYAHDAKLSIAFNRAPNTPYSLSAVTEDGKYTCSSESGTDNMRSRVPSLNAVVTDPDGPYWGQKVRARFQVFDDASGSEVWESALTTAQESGQQHSVTVPSGELTSERVYRWRAQAQDVTDDADNSRTSPWSSWCYIRPDTTPPKKPTVTSSTYPEDLVSGGIGTTGTFKFGPNGSDDVVKYAFSFNSDALSCRVVDPDSCVSGNSATVSFTPKSLGSQVLYVQSLDKAGYGSPVAVYAFGVNFPSVSAYWHLDGNGTDSAAGGKHPLTMSPNPTFDPGVGLYDNDKALALDSADDYASTSGPVVDTSKSFSVTAFVNPSSASSQVQVAVSQDGDLSSGFKLGRLGTGNCSNGATTCFGFWKSNADSAKIDNTIVTSEVPVTPGGWTFLAGVYDAGTKQMSLTACDLSRSVAVAVPSDPVTYGGTTWKSFGKAQVGRGLVNGTYGENWSGHIDDARVYAVPIPIETIRTICQGDPT